MATIRLPEDIWSQVREHLLSRSGEHFAFLLARTTMSRGQPVFVVQDVLLIPDDDTTLEPDGWSVTTAALVETVNAAARAGLSLIEAHNHGGVRPRFSSTDRTGLQEFVPYVLESLPDRPYGATVWGDRVAYGEYFMPDGGRGTIGSIVVAGRDQLHELASIDSGDDYATRFDRQLLWFTSGGQQALGHISAGIVGASGTGSHVIQLLVLLGIRRFVIVDDDIVEVINLNRIPYATPADIGSGKTAVARRFLKSANPGVNVIEVDQRIQSADAIDALRGVDVLFGCVDNDGARLVLNELSLAHRIPLVDVATGIDVRDGRLEQAGGRVAVVLPGGPCLICMRLIDPFEARYFLEPPNVREQQRAVGYVSGLDDPAPAVASLNSQIAALAVNELSVWLAGTRAVTPLQELDLLGTAHAVPGQRIAVQLVAMDPGCVECAKTDVGDAADLERFARHSNTPAGPDG